MEDAVNALLKLASEEIAVAIALEPSAPSHDAVDMFVLVKTQTCNWHLYLWLDTIAKKHSLIL